MNLSGSVRRLAPSLCILATVSIPGQAQIAPGGQDANAAKRGQPVATAQADAEDGARTEIRAPMLAPEEAGTGELEIIEPRPAGRGWERRPAPAEPSAMAGASAQHEQDLVGNSVAALSAVPSVTVPAEAPRPQGSADDLSEKWPLYGLIVSLMLAAIFLFWRLGERARVSDYELIGYTASSADGEGGLTMGSGTNPADADDEPGPSSYESLQQALQAMKAARRDRG